MLHVDSGNSAYQVEIYLLKANNRNTTTRCEICSKLTIKTLESHNQSYKYRLNDDTQWRRSGVFLVNFKLISHIVLLFPLLILNNWMSDSSRLLISKTTKNASSKVSKNYWRKSQPLIFYYLESVQICKEFFIFILNIGFYTHYQFEITSISDV